MNIKFIGMGSAFNTELGNTSAYQKKGESLFLIDCGSLVFHQLLKQDLLQDLKKIYVMITHTHPDHVASLAELIFYAYYMLKTKVEVSFPNEVLIRTLLRSVGATDDMYLLNTQQTFKIEDEALGEVQVTSRETVHIDVIPAYSLQIENEEGRIFYSGDSTFVPQDILEALANNQIDRIYQDTCGSNYEGNPHCYIGDLEEQVPSSLRSRVYCMHLDQKLTPEQVKEKGFAVVTRYQANEKR